MIDTLQVFEELQEVLAPEAARRVAEVIGRVYAELRQETLRTEFEGLRQAVVELAEAQRRTEQQVQTLAEAQRKTEQQVQTLTAQMQALTQRVEQVETQLQALTQQVQVLTQQVQTLAETQRKTEMEVMSLAKSIEELTGEHPKTREQLGGLAMTVGYTLENEAFKALPRLLARDFGLTVQGRLRRQYVIDREGKPLEVNIVGEALQDGQRVTIIGEGKVQLSKNDVDRFIRRKLKRLEGALPGRVFPVLVTHMTTAMDVEDYARSKGIAVYYSYDF